MNALLPGSTTGTPSFRQAPHNIEVEQELIGAVLINNDAFAAAALYVTADHFYLDLHRRIWTHLVRLIDRGQIANPYTLKGFFEGDEAFNPVGGAGDYLGRLAANSSSIVSVADYAKLLHDLGVKRELIRVGEEMVNTAYDPEADASAFDQIEGAEARLFELAERGQSDSGFQSFEQSIARAVQMIEAAHSAGGISGTPTGLVDLDKRLGGLQRSDLLILAGRPAMGKTALATNVAFYAAQKWLEKNGAEGSRVAFFSLEMSAEQLATRIISTETEISSERLRKGELSDDDFTNKLVPVTRTLQDVPFFIDATGGISISALRTRARRLKRQQNIGLIVVDYLQLVEASSKSRGDNRVQDVSEVSRGLKSLAKELDLPVLALSQLSRQVESRDNKRPMLSDLRESGAIEQDADIVMFVYRDEYYKRQQEPRAGTPEHATWQEEMEKVHNRAELIIGKNRHGPTDTIHLYFNPMFTKFGNLLEDQGYGSPY